LRKALAVGITAALASITLITATPAQAADPSSCAGVWVLTQSGDSETPTLSCSTNPGDGLATTTDAGHDVNAPGGFVSQIDSLPTNTDWSTNGGLWWAFCTATVATDGSLEWTVSSVGANEVNPEAGTAIGWRLTDSTAWPAATADVCPTRVSVPAASPSPSPTETSPTTTSPSPTATATTTPSATTTAEPSQAAAAAATYLRKHLPSEGAASAVYAALGMASLGQCSYATPIRQMVALAKRDAADYLGSSPGSRAAYLSILASAVGEDPHDFGGIDLLATIADDTAADGGVGSFVSPFGQGLAIIAYVRAGDPVPAAVVTTLLGQQDVSGAFGYSYGGTFYADFDSTGIAIQALHAVGGHDAAITAAVNWAAAQQTGTGYWPNEYSPVDSTGVLGSSLALLGQDTSAAVTWMTGQQLSNGGLPSTLDGTQANLMATFDGVMLLSGSSLLTVSLPLASCQAESGSDSGATDSEQLANTGATTAALGYGLAGIALVGIGGLALIGRNRLTPRARRALR
jgi:hypothetical protein